MSELIGYYYHFKNLQRPHSTLLLFFFYLYEEKINSHSVKFQPLSF